MSSITAIGTANPDHRFRQDQIAAFMLRTMRFHNGEARKLKTIFRMSGIEYRHSVLADYGRTEDFQFYPSGSADTFPSTAERLGVFRNNALPLSVAAYQNLKSAYKHLPERLITHLVVVSCTGMYAPGLDIELVKALGLNSSVQRTAINFMGCYAAFNALKIADAFCKSDARAKVLVICTELCSLHFQTESSEDNLLANALFADGSAAVLVERESASALQLELRGFHNELAIEGEESMAWAVGDLGFEMRLSSYVPDMIRSGIGALTKTLLRETGVDLQHIRYFAIHPGGKRILEVIEEELGLQKEKNAAAYHVLKNFGNMSSATVLFVLKELVSRFVSTDVNEQILSFAFGPGLTLESMIIDIKKIPHA